MCLNKCDLVTKAELEQWRDRLSGWGYQPMFISVRTGLGIYNEAANDSQNEVSESKSSSPSLSEEIDSSLLPSPLGGVRGGLPLRGVRGGCLGGE